jgi:hypothetical protein
MKARSTDLLPIYVLEPCPKRPGYTTIRMRENAKPYTETHDGQTINGYEYDEYCLIVEDRAGLCDEVESNFAAYIAHAKAQEEQDAFPSETIARQQKIIDEQQAIINALMGGES